MLAGADDRDLYNLLAATRLPAAACCWVSERGICDCCTLWAAQPPGGRRLPAAVWWRVGSLMERTTSTLYGLPPGCLLLGEAPSRWH